MPDNRKPLKYGAFPVCRNYTVRAHLHNEPAGQRRSAEGRVGAAGTLGHRYDRQLCPRDAGNQAYFGTAAGQDGSQEVVSVRQNFPLFFLIREKSRESVLLKAGKMAGNAVFSGVIGVATRQTGISNI